MELTLSLSEIQFPGVPHTTDDPRGSDCPRISGPAFWSSGMSLASCAGAPGSIPGLAKECHITSTNRCSFLKSPCTFYIYGALGKKAFCRILKRWLTSWITGQNVQKLQICRIHSKYPLCMCHLIVYFETISCHFTLRIMLFFSRQEREIQLCQ